MKTVLDKLSDEQANKEVKQFAHLSFYLSIITLFIFGWAAVISTALGGRAFLLTYHKGTKKRGDLMRLRILSGIAVVLGIVGLIIVGTSQ